MNTLPSKQRQYTCTNLVPRPPPRLYLEIKSGWRPGYEVIHVYMHDIVLDAKLTLDTSFTVSQKQLLLPQEELLVFCMGVGGTSYTLELM